MRGAAAARCDTAERRRRMRPPLYQLRHTDFAIGKTIRRKKLFIYCFPVCIVDWLRVKRFFGRLITELFGGNFLETNYYFKFIEIMALEG